MKPLRTSKIDIVTIYNGTTKLAMSGNKTMGKMTTADALNYKIRIWGVFTLGGNSKHRVSDSSTGEANIMI